MEMYGYVGKGFTPYCLSMSATRKDHGSMSHARLLTEYKTIKKIWNIDCLLDPIIIPFSLALKLMESLFPVKCASPGTEVRLEGIAKTEKYLLTVRAW